jgi:putative membrane protein
VRFLIWVVVNALAIAAAAWLLDGITVTGDSEVARVVTMLVVGLIFGLVNTFVTPVVKLLSLPFILLTLGLLIFVINALMLLLTSWIAGLLGVGFHVDGFWTAVWGAIIVSIASWILNLLIPGDR